jgi:hypothetical protein
MRVMERSSAGRFTSRRGWAARRVLLGGLAACRLAALGAAPAGAFTDLSGGAFQILAPGEEGGYPPNEFSTDQGVLYNALTSLQGNVTTRKLEHDYLSEKFGVVGPVLRVENTGAGGP